MKVKYLFLVIVLFLLPNISCSANIIVGFSPYGNAQKVVLMAIHDAHEHIDIAAYGFTSKLISFALLEAHQKGIKIRVIGDKKANHGKYTAITFLRNKGISVRLNGQYAIHHNKFIIVDNKSVQTGSFNYSQNAAYKNAENVVYIKNEPEIARLYIEEFERLWNEAQTIQPKY
ncbi:phospholipase D family nuclease [Candidatus Pantoea carbekii]|uniref:phospholipase D family nuclease n=1 Tax=Candidatus Pantoea carbekii TaxID=1235990 RepID=UPI000A7EDF7F|nr:phospholipase D family protein [Candidatus Pantoea carbekii]